MSDLIAVLVVGARALHCVDFDRPYWYLPDAQAGGVIPAPESFVADAVLALASDQLGLRPFSLSSDAGIDAHVFPTASSSAPALAAARRSVYEAPRPGLLYVAVIQPEGLIVSDLARFAMPTYTAVAGSLAEGLRP